jgi:lipoprotein-releasing system ATP-binding protein
MDYTVYLFKSVAKITNFETNLVNNFIKTLISCINITKSYQNLTVLKEINLEVPFKEILCITGESGAGKSTLLHTLGTLIKPDSGSIRIDGMETADLKGNALSQFRNRNLGFIFQFHQLVAELTALENAMLPLLIAGFDKKKAKEQAEERLVYFGLGDRLLHKPSQLSGGEQQRVSIARALAMNPKVILADEPSGNLDSKTAKLIHEWFFKMRDDFNLTFVIVTHNPELAQMADRRVLLLDGAVVDVK